MLGHHVENMFEMHVDVILWVVAVIERRDCGIDAFPESL
jgi:hypothetical protein